MATNRAFYYRTGHEHGIMELERMIGKIEIKRGEESNFSFSFFLFFSFYSQLIRREEKPGAREEEEKEGQGKEEEKEEQERAGEEREAAGERMRERV